MTHDNEVCCEDGLEDGNGIGGYSNGCGRGVDCMRFNIWGDGTGYGQGYGGYAFGDGGGVEAPEVAQ